MTITRTGLLYTLLVCMGAGFFYGVELIENSYVLKAWWDLGHTLFFALLSWLLLSRLTAQQYVLQLAVIVGCLLVGAAIEGIQLFIDREASLSDIARNTLGILIGFFIYQRKAWQQSTSFAYRGLLIFIVAGVSIVCWKPSLETANWADSQIRPDSIFLTNHPWRNIRIEENYGSTVTWNDQTAIIAFSDQRFSGFTLSRFNRDWSTYKHLVFAFNNPHKHASNLTCRVHDLKHPQRGNRFNDRFNTELTLLPGMNHFRVAVEEIRLAPSERPMDMSQIDQLICFITGATATRTTVTRTTTSAPATIEIINIDLQ